MNAKHPFLGPAENSADTRTAYTLNPDPLTPQPRAGGLDSGSSSPAAPGAMQWMMGFGAVVQR